MDDGGTTRTAVGAGVGATTIDSTGATGTADADCLVSEEATSVSSGGATSRTDAGTGNGAVDVDEGSVCCSC